MLLLVDARDVSTELAAEDDAILARLPAALPRVVVHNKTDLAALPPRAERVLAGTVAHPHVWLSAKSGEGIDLLEAEVQRVMGIDSAAEDTFLARERHLEALRMAAACLAQAYVHLAGRPPPVELFAEELRLAQNALVDITGEFTADDLLGVIFGRFCIGK